MSYASVRASAEASVATLRRFRYQIGLERRVTPGMAEEQGTRSFPSRNFAVNVAAEAGAMPMIRDALVILNFRQSGCGFVALVAEGRG
ncbi:hypothetical protein [Paenirhodobacter sp. CAU 1674]|uniref:hypothetical protein n=1 Tax=Paenirhodobacter sp. CAU 1674 TaxID=3032596 RepID=UPI0023D98BCA|nr:hypothetical protein [Paenirhodobacter sp. CAU 1674]MDF2142645.1 hypothetical protein [Paenirhodobacter sp. CAU 1674]